MLRRLPRAADRAAVATGGDGRSCRRRCRRPIRDVAPAPAAGTPPPRRRLARRFDWVGRRAARRSSPGSRARLAWIGDRHGAAAPHAARAATDAALGFDDLQAAIGATRADPVVGRGPASRHVRRARAGRPAAGRAEVRRPRRAARRRRARAPSRQAPRLGVGRRARR